MNTKTNVIFIRNGHQPFYQYLHYDIKPGCPSFDSLAAGKNQKYLDKSSSYDTVKVSHFGGL